MPLISCITWFVGGWECFRQSQYNASHTHKFHQSSVIIHPTNVNCYDFMTSTYGPLSHDVIPSFCVVKAPSSYCFVMILVCYHCSEHDVDQEKLPLFFINLHRTYSHSQLKYRLSVLVIKASFSFHKRIPKNTHMTTLYTNLSLYITFTMINYIRQE